MEMKKCYGECFEQSYIGYKRKIGSCNCILYECTCCHMLRMPELLWLSHNKKCMECAMSCGNKCIKTSEDLCKHCGTKLMPIGNSRINGRAHNDWDTRKLHKKCWLDLKKDDEIDLINEYNKSYIGCEFISVMHSGYENFSSCLMKPMKLNYNGFSDD